MTVFVVGQMQSAGLKASGARLLLCDHEAPAGVSGSGLRFQARRVFLCAAQAHSVSCKIAEQDRPQRTTTNQSSQVC